MITLIVLYSIGATAVTAFSYTLGVFYVLGTNIPEIFKIVTEFLGSMFR